MNDFASEQCNYMGNIIV